MKQAAIHDIDALRSYVGQQAPFIGRPDGLKTGIEALDHLLAPRGGGGLPKGAITVLQGPQGSGRSSLAARMLAHETEQGRPAAWVDVRGTLYPPALQQAGLALDRLLLVRAIPERALYAAEQLMSSGVFKLVVVSGLDGHLRPTHARRLQIAAEAMEGAGLLLLEPDKPRLSSVALELKLRRRAGGILVSVVRDRMGPSNRKALIALNEERNLIVAA